ncbi:hypothetical protein T492DRAFT_908569 [Pavlovales sp. CCMP2436]|nr:hypothetical protein T492DRAFT_908569 [Pavlovales sp. CCMP2436]
MPARGGGLRLVLVLALVSAGAASSEGNATTGGVSAAATLGTYPGYEGPISVSGTVSFEEVEAASGSIRLSGTLGGLPANSTVQYHVHEGISCGSAGGHFYATGEADPWDGLSTPTDSAGSALVMHDAVGFSLGGDAMDVLGRAFVVHDADGTRVGCGVIRATDAPIACAA